MVNSQLSNPFLGAAGYLREHGWQRGELGIDGGPRCAGGALMSAMSMTHTCQLESWLQEVGFARLTGQPEPAGAIFPAIIQRYNDLVAGDVHDVIALFEGIALQAELKTLAKTQPRVTEPELAPVAWGSDEAGVAPPAPAPLVRAPQPHPLLPCPARAHRPMTLESTGGDPRFI